MNVLLLFFALPVAVIIFALVLQKLLDCPILVALTIFAVFLIVTFTVASESFLVFAILYTILAYITAVISRFIKNFIKSQNNNNCNCNNNNNNCDCDCDWRK